jgi:hypothetical protein
MPHRIIRLLLWSATLLVLGGLLTGAYFVHQEMSAERAAESAGDRVAVERRSENRLVKLSDPLAKSLGIEWEPATDAQWYETAAVYGRVVPNPRATYEVRSPFAGVLRAGDEPWPEPGRQIKAGPVGRVDVRVGPQDRLDLESKRTAAHQKVKGAEEAQRTVKARAERVAKSESVPPRDKEEARLALIEADTALSTARADEELWDKALKEIDAQGANRSGKWTRPLVAPADGEVVELGGQPGTSVEAGGLVVKLVDFRRVLLRLDLPPEVAAAGAPAEVQVSGAANRTEAASLRARLVGAAPQVDPVSQWVGYLYEADAGSAGTTWRPGLFVRAEVRAAGAAPQKAVAVPAGALLYHQGRALVYVHTEPGKFARREVRVLGRDGDRWLLAPRPPFAPPGVSLDGGEDVVKAQAQVLLGEEFRSDVDND